MTKPTENLFPTTSLLRSRSDRERMLGQRAVVVWLYGLSGSGKSTLANALDRRLASEGFHSFVLDGDNLRMGLNRGLGFTDQDRHENIRRVAEVAKLFVAAGQVVICAFITPRRELRELARSIVGPDDFMEVFLEASYEACAARDPKGLYARASRDAVPAFTGRDSVFESPETPDLTLNTTSESLDACLDRLHAVVRPRVVPQAEVDYI